LPTKRLVQRYKIINALPKEQEEIKNIAELMYKRMLEREEEGIAKLRQVIYFATNDECEFNMITTMSICYLLRYRFGTGPCFVFRG